MANCNDFNERLFSDTMNNSVICAGCGLDLTSTPKIRRSLGPNSNVSADVRGRVMDLWKELASEIQQNMVILSDKLKMCRTCFNVFDKFAVKKAELFKNLRVALGKFNLYPAEQADRAARTEASVLNKRPSEECHPAARKVVVEQPLLLPSNEPSSPFATVSKFIQYCNSLCHDS